MTFKEQLAAKIAQAQEKATEARAEAQSKLLENETFIETQRVLAAKDEEVTALGELIAQCNMIPAFTAKDGKKYGVTVYPFVGFNMAINNILGIIANVPFIDEQILAYSAILDISAVELLEAQNSLGRPAYFKDGEVHEAIPFNIEALAPLVKSIGLKLGVYEYNLDLGKAQLDNYFLAKEVSARKKKEAFLTTKQVTEVAEQLVNSTTLTVED